MNEIKILKKRNQKVSKLQKEKFLKNLYKIGYPKIIFLNQRKYFRLLTIAFQRKYRQKLVNGLIDQECYFISKNLLKKLK